MSGRPVPPRSGSEERILRAVDPDEGVPSSEVPDGRSRWLGFGLLALVLVAVLVAYAVERDRAASLAAEVGRLESELTTVRAEVKAYEFRMANVSAAVEELSSRIGELRSLVRQPVDGSPAVAPQPAAP